MIFECKHSGCKILAFVGAKGGCGATTVSCHLAVEIARRAHARGERPVLLADFDLNAGSIGFVMGLPYPALDVMAPPNPILPRVPPDSNRLDSYFQSIRAQYDCAFIDLGRGLNTFSLAVLEHIDELYLVTVPDVMAFAQTRQMVQALMAIGYGREQIRLVLNRTWKGADRRLSQGVEKMSGLRVFATLPSDYSAHYEAGLQGTLLSCRSGFARQIARLANRITGLIEEERRPALSLFGSLQGLSCHRLKGNT